MKTLTLKFKLINTTGDPLVKALKFLHLYTSEFILCGGQLISRYLLKGVISDC